MRKSERSCSKICIELLRGPGGGVVVACFFQSNSRKQKKQSLTKFFEIICFTQSINQRVKEHESDDRN